MGKSAVVITSSPLSADAPATRSIGCPFGSNCSCVFAKVQPSPAARTLTTTPLPNALDTEVAYWTEQGWHVTETAPGEVVLERQLSEGFCLNLLLTVFTGFLWLAYLIPTSRHPRIDTRRITLAADGSISVTSTLARR